MVQAKSRFLDTPSPRPARLQTARNDKTICCFLTRRPYSIRLIQEACVGSSLAGDGFFRADKRNPYRNFLSYNALVPISTIKH